MTVQARALVGTLTASKLRWIACYQLQARRHAAFVSKNRVHLSDSTQSGAGALPCSELGLAPSLHQSLLLPQCYLTDRSVQEASSRQALSQGKASGMMLPAWILVQLPETFSK